MVVDTEGFPEKTHSFLRWIAKVSVTPLMLSQA